MFQSTHPRGVRPTISPYWQQTVTFQSTHPRGVRRSAVRRRTTTAPVSIHAPAWGATSFSARSGSQMVEFQSTHPRGVRPRRPWPGRRPRRVSIHAPAWGATPDSMALFCALFSFNPRTRVGCDYELDFLKIAVGRGFNPRTRVGCDVSAVDQDGDAEQVSIHAPAWGATRARRE